MATYHQLQRDLATKALFNNRVTTLEELGRTTEDKTTAFLALDTEHVVVVNPHCNDRILHQVGLAFQKLGARSGVPSLSLMAFRSPLAVGDQKPIKVMEDNDDFEGLGNLFA